MAESLGFGRYLGSAEQTYQQIEVLIARIEAGDLRVAVDQERELRRIFTRLQREVEYREIAGISRINPSSPETRRARRRALAALERWTTATMGAFRHTPARMEDYLLGRSVLGEMREIQNAAIRDWRNTVGLLESGTPAQQREAARLLADTQRLREKFSRRGAPLPGGRRPEGFNTFMEDVTGEASFGKAENMIALVNRAQRDAQLAIVRFTSGTTGGTTGRATEALDDDDIWILEQLPAREATDQDIADQAASIRFDRNRLRLSSTAHARGLYNTATIRLASAVGVLHFLFYLTKPHRPRVRGISAEQLWQIRLGEPDTGAIRLPDLHDAVAAVLDRPVEDIRAEVERRFKLTDRDDPQARREMLIRMVREAEPVQSWLETYRAVNAGRRQIVAFGANLTIHPGSQEFYLPIPPTLLGEARRWSTATRRAA